MLLIFVRHGQTRWNIEGRYQGRIDMPMCAAGFETTRRLAQRLRTTQVQLLLASPLRRARTTAALLGEAIGGVTSVVDDRLVEIDFGAWQGLTQTELKARWPQLMRRWKHAPDSVRFPGGESLSTAQERLQSFLTRPPWPEDSGNQCVIAVSHSGPIRLAGLLAEGRPLAHFRRLTVDPGAVHAFDWRADGRLRRIEFEST